MTIFWPSPMLDNASFRKRINVSATSSIHFECMYCHFPCRKLSNIHRFVRRWVFSNFKSFFSVLLYSQLSLLRRNHITCRDCFLSLSPSPINRLIEIDWFRGFLLQHQDTDIYLWARVTEMKCMCRDYFSRECQRVLSRYGNMLISSFALID